MTRFHKLVLATLCGKLRVRVLLAKKKRNFATWCRGNPLKNHLVLPTAEAEAEAYAARLWAVQERGEEGGVEGGETTTPAAVRVNAVSKVFCLLLLPFGFCATSVKAPQCQQFHTHTRTHTDKTRTQAHTPAHSHTHPLARTSAHTHRETFTHCSTDACSVAS